MQEQSFEAMTRGDVRNFGEPCWQPIVVSIWDDISSLVENSFRPETLLLPLWGIPGWLPWPRGRRAGARDFTYLFHFQADKRRSDGNSGRFRRCGDA